MRKTLTCIWFVTISISFMLFSSSLPAQSPNGCAVLSRIWYNGKEVRGRESDIIRVYHADRPVEPQLGMPLELRDRIEGKDPLSEFEIIWHPNSQTPSSQIIRASQGNPVHVKIVDCDGSGEIESLSDTLVVIIQKLWPFKVKTPSATAGVRGTNFSVKLLANGQTTVLLITKGEGYLENEFGSITVNESEEGTATKGSRPTKKTVEADYISREVGWVFLRQGLPKVYGDEFRRYLPGSQYAPQKGSIPTPFIQRQNLMPDGKTFIKDTHQDRVHISQEVQEQYHKLEQMHGELVQRFDQGLKLERQDQQSWDRDYRRLSQEYHRLQKELNSSAGLLSPDFQQHYQNFEQGIQQYHQNLPQYRHSIEQNQGIQQYQPSIQQYQPSIQQYQPGIQQYQQK